MWKIFRTKVAIATAATLMTSMLSQVAGAQTISQNISGFNLPGVQLPQGHDEVRAADGTTCRSAVSGSGAYLDVGVIGDDNNTSGMSSYGRLVIPLGKKPKRLDCSRLYDLEVRRLELELRLMELGLNRGVTPPAGTAVGGDISPEEVAAASDQKVQKGSMGAEVQVASANNDDWDDDGWTTDGLKEN